MRSSGIKEERNRRVRGWGAIDLEERAQSIERAGADPGSYHRFDVPEEPVLLAILDDSLREAGPDAGQEHELVGTRDVGIDALSGRERACDGRRLGVSLERHVRWPRSDRARQREQREAHDDDTQSAGGARPHSVLSDGAACGCSARRKVSSRNRPDRTRRGARGPRFGVLRANQARYLISLVLIASMLICSSANRISSVAFFIKALFSNFVAFGELKRGLTLLSR